MSRSPRIPGFEYRGTHRYFLTFCTRDRRRLFADAELVTVVLSCFRRAAQSCGFAILAYCFMPDHVHLLVEGCLASADLRRFVKRAEQSAGQVHDHRFGEPPWQEGYYDRVLRPSDDARAIARYIIANPVRARLAGTPLDYPYLGSDVWELRDLLESVT